MGFCHDLPAEERGLARVKKKRKKRKCGRGYVWGLTSGLTDHRLIDAPNTPMIKTTEDINEHSIAAYLDKPYWMPLNTAVELLLAIEIGSDKYLTDTKRVAVYCNLKDSVELYNSALATGWKPSHN